MKRLPAPAWSAVPKNEISGHFAALQSVLLARLLCSQSLSVHDTLQSNKAASAACANHRGPNAGGVAAALKPARTAAVGFCSENGMSAMCFAAQLDIARDVHKGLVAVCASFEHARVSCKEGQR